MAETSVTTWLGDRKRMRLESGEADSITSRRFNAVLCAVLAWGFVVNAAMVYFLGEPLLQAVASIKWWMVLLIYAVPTVAGIIIAARSTNPFISFLGYNLVVLPIGLMLAVLPVL